MKIAGNSFEEFHSVACIKKLIAFGASDFLRVISLNYKDLKLDDYIECVADNSVEKQGTIICGNWRSAAAGCFPEAVESWGGGHRAPCRLVEEIGR